MKNLKNMKWILFFERRHAKIQPLLHFYTPKFRGNYTDPILVFPGIKIAKIPKNIFEAVFAFFGSKAIVF